MNSQPQANLSDADPRAATAVLPMSFSRALIGNVVGLVVMLGLVLLGALAWQGIASTEKAERRDIAQTLNSSTERLQLLTRAAEMTADSAVRASLVSAVTGATLRSTLEQALAAFEQRPELSYLGIILPDAGEYGTLERTAKGEILLWLFPGTLANDPVTRIFTLTDRGFVLRESRPYDGYDPRGRPFYQAALAAAPGGTWMRAYPWIIHDEHSEPLWGFSYVRALRDQEGRLVSVLDTDFDLPAFNAFLKSIADEYHARLQVVELGETPRLIGGAGVGRTPLPLNAELAPLIKSTDAVFTARMALEGERRWVAARRVTLPGGPTWLVVASRDAPLMEASLRRQLYQLAGMGLVVVAGLALLSARMARHFGRPLAELERRLDRIERHGLQAPEPGLSVVDAFRETQLLGKALDRMSVAVRQQVLAKEQQLASIALKAAIFDHTNTAIFTLDARGVIIEWNAVAEQQFGLARAGALGQPVAQAIRAPDGPADWDAIQASQGAGTFTLLGEQGPFEAEARAVAFEQDGLQVRTFFLNDVSEYKRAQARLLVFNAELEQRVAHRTRELRALNDELESFCHSVSHDLRAPLRGISGFTEILAKNHAGALDEKARGYLGRVQLAACRMDELIDDLLKLSRVSREEMHREKVDLSAIARQVLADLRQAEPQRRVDISIEDGLAAEGDARLLRIALENLLGNAWKFTSKTPDARISFAAMPGENGEPGFAVADNGAGFDMRYARRLFAPFQRLHRAVEFPGTGIGLATVQRIVKRHGGYIAAQAEPGRGARFWFSLDQAAS
ncbi:MAG TPA: ATP-binding protein [Bordetella sp.]